MMKELADLVADEAVPESIKTNMVMAMVKMSGAKTLPHLKSALQTLLKAIEEVEEWDKKGTH